MQRFPRVFTRRNSKRPKRPLAVGIAEDIAARCPDIDRTDLARMLRLYTGGTRYLAALTEGAARIDLDGAPAGCVTARQARGAAHALERMRANEARQRPTAAPAAGAPETIPAGAGAAP